MKKELIKHLTVDFESCTNHTKNEIEFWFARDVQHLLSYSEWRNFTKVINRAKTACETSGHHIADHFVDVNKTDSYAQGCIQRCSRYNAHTLRLLSDSPKR